MQRYKHYLFCLLLFVSMHNGFYLFAQADTIALALEKKIKASANDTTLAKSYFELIRYFLTNDSAKAYKCVAKLYDTAHSSQNPLLLSRAYSYYARFYENYNQNNLALRYYDSALAHGRTAKDFNFLTGTLCNRGYILSQQQLKQQALESFIEAAQVAERQEVNAGAKAHATYSLGRMYYDWKNFNEAIPTFEKSLAICIQQGITPGIGQNNLFLGKSHSAKNEHNVAIKYLENNLAVQKKLGIKSEITEAFIALCDAYLAKGDVQQAAANIAKAKETAVQKLPEQLLHKLKIAEIKTELAQKKFAIAQASLTQLLPMLKKQHSHQLLIEGLDLLVNTQYKLEDYKSAYESFKQNQLLKDSITSLTNHENIIALQQAYKLSIQDKQRHQLESKNEYLHVTKMSWQELYYLLIPIMVVLTILLFRVGSNYYKLKRESIKHSKTAEELRIHQAEVEEQSSLLKNRINRTRNNPAFVVLCLDSINEKIKSGDVDNANLLLSKLSLYMRNVLAISNTDTVKLTDEIQLLETLMHVIKLAHDSRIRFTIEITGAEEAEEWSLPPLLLCELAGYCSNLFIVHTPDIEIKVDITSEKLNITFLLQASIKDAEHFDSLQQSIGKKLELFSLRSDAIFEFNYTHTLAPPMIKMEVNAALRE
ncbi:MAG: tetratricopeptide repeat protein [Bacteroidetes bacterium]|nr:tetratricopeptide repeat protein [Bacteroidota bacterium]